MNRIMDLREAKSLLEYTRPRTDFPDDPVVRAFETIIKLYKRIARGKAKVIELNSSNHYQVVQGDNRMILLEFPEECPGMGDREEFTRDEGEEVASWRLGEEVNFVYAIAGPIIFDEETEIHCGDDIRYIFNNKAKV